MGLKIYKNNSTGEERRSLKKLDETQWTEILAAPNPKFMEASDAFHGKSRIKDVNKILKARSRNFSRDNEIDENIQLNKLNGLDGHVARNFLNKNGVKRKKVDDL